MAHGEERLASYLKREIADFLAKRSEVPEGAFLSVTGIEIAPSLEDAKVFILVFPESASAEAMRGLKALEREARKYLATRLKRRKIPKILFRLDQAQNREIGLEKLLEKVKNE